MMDPASNKECLDPEDVAMFFEDGTGAVGRPLLEEHVAGCARCRELLSALVKLESALDPGLAMTARSEPTPAASDRAAVPLAAGMRVGRYEVLARLGQGGMGVVYCAWDPELGRKIALKLLSGAPDRAAYARLHDRLRREAQAMAQVTHPNVVTVYDVGTWEGQIFIAMELVSGQTLSQWLAAGDRSWQEVLVLFLAAGKGLAGAHAAGIVHRDFKPTNVLVGQDGRVCVSDFGLAATMADAVPPSLGVERAVPRDGASEDGTTATFCLGTPFFMAPEQLRGAAPDVRSDQYSFGVALHMAITGEHPCPGASMEEILQACLEGRVRRVAHRRMPRQLWTVIRRSVSVQPEDRHPSMSAMLTALGRCRARRRGVVAYAMIASIALLGAIVTQLPGRRPPVTPGRDAAPERAVSRYDASALAHAPDLLAAYDREWSVLHGDACELSPAGCSMQATNLLRNADFARAGQAWDPADRGLDLAWRGGLRATASAHGGALAQEVPWIISPLRAYRFTIHARAASASVPATGRITLSSLGPAGVRASSTRLGSGASWTEATVALPGDAGRDRFRTELALDPGSALEVDHAELVDAGLIDPGFELATPAVWRPVNSSAYTRMSPVTTDAVDGERALEVVTTRAWASVAQDTIRAPVFGTTYTFRAWLRAATPGSVVGGSLTLWALSARETAVHTSFLVGHEWTQVEASLHVTDHGHSALRAEVYVGSSHAPLQIDATSLTPAGLVDASFESGALGWYSPQGDALAGALRTADGALDRPGAGAFRDWRPDGAKDGARWLRLTTAQRSVAIAQDLGKPLRGATYRFSAWLRAAPGAIAPAEGKVAIHALGGAGEVKQTTFRVSTEWTLVAVSFTVRDERQSGLRVVISLDSPGAQLDIDGTRLGGAIVLPAPV